VVYGERGPASQASRSATRPGALSLRGQGFVNTVRDEKAWKVEHGRELSHKLRRRTWRRLTKTASHGLYEDMVVGLPRAGGWVDCVREGDLGSDRI
jgi:hypothetical protein